jgi:hydrogenase nickel incorporation protein HypB
MTTIPIAQPVTASNDELAASLRKQFMEAGVLTLNLISSPGSGKTSLLERTLERLGKELKIKIIEGDPFTSLDRDRVQAAGAESVQINTEGGCHLDALMVQKALAQLELKGTDLLIVENVGNLLCPTGWDLGEDHKVVVASLTEGEDKPLKYPQGFVAATAVVLNKIDLEPYLSAKVAALSTNLLKVNADLAVFPLSCTTGEGLDAWCDWLKKQVLAKKQRSKKSREH